MSNRSHSQIYYHFVWTTSGKANWIEAKWEHRLYGYIIEKCRLRKYIPFAIGGLSDHIHILLRAFPEMTPSDIVGHIKGSSSHFVNEQGLIPNRFSWKDGYGVTSISPKDTFFWVEYIKNQKQHHWDGSLVDEYEQTDNHTLEGIPECQDQNEFLFNSSWEGINASPE